MSRPEKPDAHRTGGFTLVEALAALTVMAMGLAGIGELAASNMRTSARTMTRFAQTETARAIWSGLPDRDGLAYGRTAGSFQGHAWRVDAEPVPTSAGTSESTPWRPQAITLVVRSPAGAVTEIQTIRLRRGVAK